MYLAMLFAMQCTGRASTLHCKWIKADVQMVYCILMKRISFKSAIRAETNPLPYYVVKLQREIYVPRVVRDWLLNILLRCLPSPIEKHGLGNHSFYSVVEDISSYWTENLIMHALLSPIVGPAVARILIFM
jgi:hypothetical protein